MAVTEAVTVVTATAMVKKSRKQGRKILKWRHPKEGRKNQKLRHPNLQEKHRISENPYLEAKTFNLHTNKEANPTSLSGMSPPPPPPQRNRLIRTGLIKMADKGKEGVIVVLVVIVGTVVVIAITKATVKSLPTQLSLMKILMKKICAITASMHIAFLLYVSTTVAANTKP